MKAAILIDPFDVHKSVALCQLAEKLGFHAAWVADEAPAHPYRDCFVTMQAILASTKKLKVLSCINPAYTRHPALLAVAVRSMEELYPGRLGIGLGPGGSLTLIPLGITLWNKPVEMVEQCTKILRALFNGETVTHTSDLVKAKDVKLFAKSEGKVPIYLAARGERMLKLVGRVADGSILTMPDGYLDVAVKKVRDSAKAAGRNPNSLDIGNTWPFAISKDGEDAKKMVAKFCTYMISDFPSEALPYIKVGPDEQEEMRRTFRQKGMDEATKLVNDRMIKAVTVCGDPEHVLKNCEYQIRCGVTQLIFGGPFGAKPEEALKLLTKEVLQHLR